MIDATPRRQSGGGLKGILVGLLVIGAYLVGQGGISIEPLTDIVSQPQTTISTQPGTSTSRERSIPFVMPTASVNTQQDAQTAPIVVPEEMPVLPTAVPVPTIDYPIQVPVIVPAQANDPRYVAEAGAPVCTDTTPGDGFGCGGGSSGGWDDGSTQPQAAAPVEQHNIAVVQPTPVPIEQPQTIVKPVVEEDDGWGAGGGGGGSWAEPTAGAVVQGGW